jgi:hypothetical protein
VLRCAEQGGEAGTGIKTRQAEPVDGATATDEGRGVTVTDEGIVFDTGWHEALL